MKKRFLTVALVVAMGMSLIACGQENTSAPVATPTKAPVATSTVAPEPTKAVEPTVEVVPTEAPVVDTPVVESTVEPTVTDVPAVEPTVAPTDVPEVKPTEVPTVEPTKVPEPTVAPTEAPKPTVEPTKAPASAELPAFVTTTTASVWDNDKWEYVEEEIYTFKFNTVYNTLQDNLMGHLGGQAGWTIEAAKYGAGDTSCEQSASWKEASMNNMHVEIINYNRHKFRTLEELSKFTYISGYDILTDGVTIVAPVTSIDWGYPMLMFIDTSKMGMDIEAAWSYIAEYMVERQQVSEPELIFCPLCWNSFSTEKELSEHKCIMCPRCWNYFLEEEFPNHDCY